MGKPTIFIVDDSRVMCEFLNIFLSEKYQPVIFTNPYDALKKIEEGQIPDAIITDLNMPQLSGVNLVKATRSYLAHTPILILSGDPSSKLRIDALEAGADDFLLKPFHPAELEVRINKLLTRQKSEVAEPTVMLKPVYSVFKELRKVAAAF